MYSYTCLLANYSCLAEEHVLQGKIEPFHFRILAISEDEIQFSKIFFKFLFSFLFLFLQNKILLIKQFPHIFAMDCISWNIIYESEWKRKRKEMSFVSYVIVNLLSLVCEPFFLCWAQLMSLLLFSLFNDVCECSHYAI